MSDANNGASCAKATVTAHLIVRGGADALDFYTRAFGAVEHFRMEMPGSDKLAHAQFQIGNSLIYLAEEFPSWGSLSPLSLNGSPVVLHLHVDDADAAFAKAVEAGATVKMPLDNMFWGDRFGKVTDPFGHEWSIAQTIEVLTPEEMAKRGQEAFASMGSGENCG